MIEKLFTGKEINSDAWLEGYYKVDPNYYGCESDEAGRIKTFERKTVHFITLTNLGGLFPIHPESLGQFTGFYDRTNWHDVPMAERRLLKERDGMTEKKWTGRRIFEGDIVLSNRLDRNGFWVVRIDRFQGVVYENVLSEKKDWVLSGGMIEASDLYNLGNCTTQKCYVVGKEFDGLEITEKLRRKWNV